MPLELTLHAAALCLLGGVANAEIKVTVRADQLALATTRLKLDKTKAERRWVTFYDTRALELYAAGLILRSRKGHHGTDDSTVKLRPMDAAKVAPSWFALPNFKCEADMNGEKSVTSCSLSKGQDAGEIDAVAVGKRPLTKLYSSNQERFISTYATRAPDYTRLVALGPTDAWVQSVKLADYPETIDTERWELPDGTVVLELSIRVPLASASTAQRAFTSYLEAAGLDTSRRDDGKTRIALDYWSKH